MPTLFDISDNGAPSNAASENCGADDTNLDLEPNDD